MPRVVGALLRVLGVLEAAPSRALVVTALGALDFLYVLGVHGGALGVPGAAGTLGALGVLGVPEAV